MKTLKTCSCGETFKEIPKEHKINEFGSWWNCPSCDSTLLKKDKTMEKYTLRDLNKMTTVSASQFDDLKIETGDTRIWLSRMGIEDGQPYNNQVTIEKCIHGSWNTITQYEAE